MAKAEVIGAVYSEVCKEPIGRQPLPLEAAYMYIGDEKHTTDLSKTLRYHIRRAQAKQFYLEKQIMGEESFESVSWEDVRDDMNGKGRMYQIWYGKQGSGYCGTVEMLHR